MKDKAVVFAGQGAQYIGMGKDLVEAYPECKMLFDKADAVLGYNLSKICFEGPKSELTKSSNCQPAIFVISVACYRAFAKEAGNFVFKGMAGLSLGEWTALHVAGGLSFEDTLRVLEARGRFMQEACEEKQGGMISIIGLPMEKLEEICKKTGVEIANFNSLEQTVLSGEKIGIAEAERIAKEMDARSVIVLNVAGAFHSSLMKPAARKLENFLNGIDIKPLSIPVVANVTGQPHGSSEEIKKTMVKQITSLVKWVFCINWFTDNGVKSYLEFGPGKVISELIKQIDKNSVVNNIQDYATLMTFLSEKAK